MKSISYLDMVQELLNEDEFLQFKEFYDKPITKSIKILNNRWMIEKNISEIVKEAFSQEWNLSESDFSYCWKKYNDVLFATRKENLSSLSIWSHYLHQAGLIYVQEMAAWLSAQVLWVHPWDKVLDLCAAPWWKSIQIADAVIDEEKNKIWFALSNELDSWRLKALQSNFYRCGIWNSATINQDGRVIWERLPELFDKVLVDAPCSWEWIQFKSWKKVRQRDEKKCRNLSDLQTQLVESWLKALKVWWELVYSTCTTNVLENEIVVFNILKKYWEDIELLNVEIEQKSKWIEQWRWEKILDSECSNKVARFRPHVQKTWWFFIAKFRKNSSFWDSQISSLWKQQTIPSFWALAKNFKPSQKADLSFSESEIREYLHKNRWIQKNENIWFFESKFTINVSPKCLVNLKIEENFPNVQIWIPVFKILNDAKNNSKKLIPLIWLSQIFSNFAEKNIIEISEEQLKNLMGKQDLRDDRLFNFEWEYVILKCNGIWVGLISVQKWIGKNKCF